MKTALVLIGSLAIAIVAASPATAAVGALPRLPKDVVIRPQEGSPAKVTFSHAAHVDAKRPACTTCHPALFKILGRGAPAPDAGIRHAGMEAGRHCGACHDDKAAFGLDKCALCHREE